MKKAVLTEKLSDPSLSNKELIDAGNRLTEVISELETKTERWLELSEFAE
jgi:ABC transport system ATP-binding/permease protein